MLTKLLQEKNQSHNNLNSFNAIGVMSGTSMDGLDIAACSFVYDTTWQYKINQAITIPYSMEWKNKLSEAFYLSENALQSLDIEYGNYIGTEVKKFIEQHQMIPDLIASHGHTIFHNPSQKITKQIGDGAAIKSRTNTKTINNFRLQDVLLGGQGAPLVPIGDELLFGDYDFVMNLGGFCNISYRENDVRKACDIGPCNILLNAICARIHLDYDDRGNLARQGKIIPEYFEKWNAIDYFKQQAPKSLGREWFIANYSEDINNDNYSIEDLLATASAHISDQILIFVQNIKATKYKLLCTGGGSYNDNIIKKISSLSPLGSIIAIPDRSLIDFKEAMVFAFLGVLKHCNQNNVLASVTGAIHDHSSGDVWV